MDTLKYPLSFERGSAEKLTENSIAYNSQAVALLLRTRVGEMPLEPTFGVSDSTFVNFYKSEFYRCLNTFWPEITVSALSVQERSSADGAVSVKVTIAG